MGLIVSASAIPRAQSTLFTNGMILHGRETCTAKAPKCPECVLYAECGWPQKTPK